jgi:SAM-dependent methyltransferase
MDFDNSEIAAVYDEARGLTAEVLQQWMDLLAKHVGRITISLIVDLGCGTGRFSELLAAYFGTRVIGVDPSQKMLDQAGRKLTTDRVVFRLGSAEALPIPDATADVIFMSMVFHHFIDRAVVAQECRRVLRSGGYVCVRNTTREADFPNRHFFPAMRPLIESELPTRNDVRTVFEAAGFGMTIHEVVTQVVATSWSALIDKSFLRGDSFLVRLSEDDFEAGMAILCAHAGRRDPGEAVTEEVDWFVFVK